MQAVTLKIEDQVLPAMEKTFSTGSTGFYASGKVVLNGKAYQVSASIVEIGSKPKDKAKPAAN